MEMDIHEILEHLPHRYPFLLIDRVLEIEPNKSIHAYKNVTINEPFFMGHFPHHPVMPGVLIMEALAQAGGILAFKSLGEKPSPDTVFYFAGLDEVRFKKPSGKSSYQKLANHASHYAVVGAAAVVEADGLLRAARLVRFTGAAFSGSLIFNNGAAGPVDVTVVNFDRQASTLAGGFTYVAPPPVVTAINVRGSPQAGDVVSVGANAYPQLSAGNATAMMQLRDIPMFDGAAMSDGYAGLISQVGIRSQSASYAAKVSETIATNVEKDRTSVSGVNLDEEAAKLLQYQQAYQASAKVVQIAQSIFDTLMQDLLR